MSAAGRQYERVNASVPIHLAEGGAGQTVNMSPGGVFFVVDQPMAEGNAIRFTIEFENRGGTLYLECLGQIVRVEEVGGKIGVAARISESRMERTKQLKRREEFQHEDD